MDRLANCQSVVNQMVQDVRGRGMDVEPRTKVMFSSAAFALYHDVDVAYHERKSVSERRAQLFGEVLQITESMNSRDRPRVHAYFKTVRFWCGVP